MTGWRNYSENLGVFAEHYRTFVFEFPGFGVSDDSGEHPMVGAPGSVVRFMDALGLERAHLIGNSMGGMVASRVALDAPERVERLVTIGGVGRGIFNPTPGEGIRLLVAFAEDPSRERLVRWLESMVHDPAILTEELIEGRWNLASDPEVLESTRRIFSRAAMRAIAAAADSGDAPDWTRLHKITAPTLLTWGGSGAMRATSNGRPMCPSSTSPVTPGCWCTR